MAKTYLIVHPTSRAFVYAVSEFIAEQLRLYSALPFELVVCTDIALAPVEAGSIVYVIGDPFIPFAPLTRVRTVFLNFSLLRLSGTESRAARNWIKRKQSAFISKVSCFDCVLDFLPDNASTLNHDRPVLDFMVGVNRRERRAPKHDVCFVGTETTRRVVLAKRLTRLGVHLSPMTGVNLDEVAAASSLSLNVHAYRCGNIETPRLIGSLVAGAGLVCEEDPTLHALLPTDTYFRAAYRDLPGLIVELLSDQARLAEVREAGAQWALDVYLPKCRAHWRDLVPAVERVLEHSSRR